MTTKQILLSFFIFVIGLMGGFFLNQSFSTGGKAMQSDAAAGELMRGEVPLKSGSWADAYYMSKNCSPNHPVQITTAQRRLYYVCVKSSAPK